MKCNNLLQQTSIEQAKLNFLQAVLGEDITLLNGKKDNEKEEFINYIVDIINNLNKNEKFMVTNRFGLLNGNKLTLSECSSAINLSAERARQIESKAIKKIRQFVKTKEMLNQTTKTLFNWENFTLMEIGLTRKQQWLLEDNNIYTVSKLLNFYFLNGENGLRYIVGENSARSIISKLKKLDNFEEMQESFNQQLKEKTKNKDFNAILITSLNLSIRTCNALTRGGLETLQDILNVYQRKGVDGFKEIRTLGNECLKEIVVLIERFKDLNQLDKEEILKTFDREEITIEDLKFSTRTYNALKRAGFNLLQELIDVYETQGIEEFYKFRSIGACSVDEIEQTLKEIENKNLNVANSI